MRKNGRRYCDGRHYEYDELVDAEYFRGCAWCGIEMDLCLSCRDRKFTCDRCFTDKGMLGIDHARKAARARERDRERKRVARRRILKAPKTQQTLWTREDLLGERR